MPGNAKTFILMAVMTALLMGVGLLLGGRGGALVALAFAGVGNVWAWWNSDKAMLRQNNAVPVTEANGADLLALTRDLASRAGLPMPKVYILPTEQPNAFATGRNPQNAAVAVTQGLMQTLTRDELAGVIAHELAHIQYRDTLLMTVTATLSGAIAMMGNMVMFTGNRNGRGGAGGLGAIVAVLLAPLAATLTQMAVSRTREFAADRRAAEITGDPRAMAQALARIAQAAGRTVNLPAEKNPASAAMFIVNPLSGLKLDRLFSTHPSTEERIRALIG